MLNFTADDKTVMMEAYKVTLFHLKEYLQKYSIKDQLEYMKIIFRMFHNGYFSMTGEIHLDNDYPYLSLPLEVSQGVQVMYGICCCRHATEFLYDVLCLLNFNPSLQFIWIDYSTNTWKKVDPALEKTNHITIFLNGENRFIVDLANNFIMQILTNGQLKLINLEYLGELKEYQEENIHIIGNILEKYYTYRELGVERVYK